MVKKFSRDDGQQLLGASKYRRQAPLELLSTPKLFFSKFPNSSFFDEFPTVELKTWWNDGGMAMKVGS